MTRKSKEPKELTAEEEIRSLAKQFKCSLRTAEFIARLLWDNEGLAIRNRQLSAQIRQAEAAIRGY